MRDCLSSIGEPIRNCPYTLKRGIMYALSTEIVIESSSILLVNRLGYCASHIPARYNSRDEIRGIAKIHAWKFTRLITEWTSHYLIVLLVIVVQQSHVH